MDFPFVDPASSPSQSSPQTTLDPLNPADHARVLEQVYNGQAQLAVAVANLSQGLSTFQSSLSAMASSQASLGPTISAAISSSLAGLNFSSAPPHPNPTLSPSSSSNPILIKPEKPEKFDGTKKASANLDAWLHSCRSYLRHSGLDLETPRAVEYASAFLSGSAASWFQAERQRRPDHLPDSAGFPSFSSFSDALRRSLGALHPSVKARHDLALVHQETSVDEYAVRFQRIVSNLPKLEPAAAAFTFFDGLKPKIKERLVTQIDLEKDSWQEIRDRAASLDSVLFRASSSTASSSMASNRFPSEPSPMDVSAIVSNILARKPTTPARGRSVAPRPTNSTRPRSPTPVARSSPASGSSSHLRLAPLTDTERAYLKANGGCFRCRKLHAGHNAYTCPGSSSNQSPGKGRSNTPPKN